MGIHMVSSISTCQTSAWSLVAAQTTGITKQPSATAWPADIRQVSDSSTGQEHPEGLWLITWVTDINMVPSCSRTTDPDIVFSLLWTPSLLWVGLFSGLVVPSSVRKQAPGCGGGSRGGRGYDDIRKYDFGEACYLASTSPQERRDATPKVQSTESSFRKIRGYLDSISQRLRESRDFTETSKFHKCNCSCNISLLSFLVAGTVSTSIGIQFLPGVCISLSSQNSSGELVCAGGCA